MPSLHTSLPSIVFMLDQTSKVYIDSNKYCFMTSNVVFPGYVTKPHSVTVDKGKIKTIREMKTVTSIYLIKTDFGLASLSRRHIRTLSPMWQPQLNALREQNISAAIRQICNFGKYKRRFMLLFHFCQIVTGTIKFSLILVLIEVHQLYPTHGSIF